MSMCMKLWTIIKKEYRQIVHKKSFIISTILTPVMMAGFFFLPILISKIGREVKTIILEDYSGVIMQPFLERNAPDNMAVRALKLEFKASEQADAEQRRLLQKYEEEIRLQKEPEFQLSPFYRQRILDKEIDGVVLIPEDVAQSRRIYFCALNISDFGANKYMTSAIQRILSEKVLTEKNIDVRLVEEAFRDVDLNMFKLKKEGATKSSSDMEYIMSIFMLTTLFSIIMVYGQLIMRGVIEEKNNRIMEVLISSTKPQALFYGKIVGIGLAGLTQVAVWVALAAALLKQSIWAIDTRVIGFLSFELGIYFVVFFILGYFMFSVMFSIVGAAVNTDQEAQQYAAPISYLLIIPFILGMMVTQNPHTPLMVIASIFPLFAPTLMFMRISVSVPPFFQIALSIILSVLFTWGLAWLGAKIFRVGILMYGKKPSLKEMARWLRY